MRIHSRLEAFGLRKYVPGKWTRSRTVQRITNPLVREFLQCWTRLSRYWHRMSRSTRELTPQLSQQLNLLLDSD